MSNQLVMMVLVFGCGVLFLVPVRHGGARTWILTGLNLLFLRLILPDRSLAAIFAVVVAAYLLLKAVSTRSWRIPAVAGLGALTLGLFLIHKLPASPRIFGPAQAILTAIGFSYVALRLVDLVRAVFEKRHPAPSLTSVINYLLPFHMLLAGPIQNYDDYAGQPAVPPPASKAEALRAAERVANGAFKKFVLALILQKLFLTDFHSRGWHFLLEAQAFYIWLYLDFSGLSDIAVGIGGLLGIRTPENFNRPYFARNMINFWERWHISLSQFIRSNVFTPIQLRLVRWTMGRYTIWCASAAFAISFTLCGLWHGIDSRWLLWGLVNAAGLVITNVYRYYLARVLGAKGVKKYLANQAIRVVATLITFEFVVFTMAILREPL